MFKSILCCVMIALLLCCEIKIAYGSFEFKWLGLPQETINLISKKSKDDEDSDEE